MMTVLLVIAAIILIIGLVRVVFSPYTGFLDMIGQMLLIDLLIDLLGAIFEALVD